MTEQKPTGGKKVVRKSVDHSAKEKTMPQNNVNPKDVEEFMIGLGFKKRSISYGYEGYFHTEGGLSMFRPDQAAFLYQQTLLARIDECKKAPAGSAMRKRRLAELTQLLQGSHNREEKK